MATQKNYTYQTGVDGDGQPITKTELIYTGVTWTPADESGNRQRLHFETNTDSVVSLTNGKTLTTLLAEDLAAAKAYADEKITDLIGTAPDTLDTIEELAAALKNNADIVDTLNAATALKLDASVYNEFINGKEAVGEEGQEGYVPATTGYSAWKAGVDANLIKLAADIETLGNTNTEALEEAIAAVEAECATKLTKAAFNEFLNGKPAVGEENSEGYVPAVVGFNEWKSDISTRLETAESDIDALQAISSRATPVVIGTTDVESNASVLPSDLYFQIL